MHETEAVTVPRVSCDVRHGTYAWYICMSHMHGTYAWYVSMGSHIAPQGGGGGAARTWGFAGASECRTLDHRHDRRGADAASEEHHVRVDTLL